MPPYQCGCYTGIVEIEPMGLERPTKLTVKFARLAIFGQGWTTVCQRDHSQRLASEFSKGLATAFTLEFTTFANERGENL
ncbi:MAG: hypothetical protein ACK40X_02145 [Armatimonadota bacterium]